MAQGRRRLRTGRPAGRLEPGLTGRRCRAESRPADRQSLCNRTDVSAVRDCDEHRIDHLRDAADFSCSATGSVPLATIDDVAAQRDDARLRADAYVARADLRIGDKRRQHGAPEIMNLGQAQLLLRLGGDDRLAATLRDVSLAGRS